MVESVGRILGIAVVLVIVGVLLFPQPSPREGIQSQTSVDASRSTASGWPVGPSAQERTYQASPSTGPISYNLTVTTHPSKCTLTVSGTPYFNGGWNASMTPGYHLIQAALCPGEAFVSWTSTAGPLNSTTELSATLDVESNGTLTATFAFGYNVTFNETGLLLGSSWTVGLNGNFQTQSGYQIIFGASNGTYAYVITRIANYTTKYSGSVTVDGADLTIQVKFTSIVYTTMFQETGLPAETRWSVIYNGTIGFSLSPDLSFAECNGTYLFTIPTMIGYSTNVTSGNVTVSGHNTTVLIRFSAASTSGSKLPAFEVYVLVGGTAAAVVVVGAAVYLWSRKEAPPAP